MTTIEIARRMAELGETQEALRAYALALNEDIEPSELLEAAAYTLDNGGDYKLAYTTFVGLYNAGYFREQLLPLMTKAFYEPNIRQLKGRYERNVKLLKNIPIFSARISQILMNYPSFSSLTTTTTAMCPSTRERACSVIL